MGDYLQSKTIKTGGLLEVWFLWQQFGCYWTAECVRKIQSS